ncbi:ABC transporter ATP-binding protein [Rhizobium laguerreae]|uniref:ABC transporter ATP-binding protein n=1 Tax=Rhizobium laguerreae TaxID=1076926 RepID=UPI001C90AD4A|nr:ABC transporter ATP-binding protein [Rhizobium laguerreae]MBY3224352.1 ABC transporter ATP-binding protein [Rhizobium laguerreae]
MTTATFPLSASGLRLTRPVGPVLDDIGLAVPRGKVSVIIGPNACGKSTLLRCLARLLRPDEGEVLLEGDPIDRQKSKQVARQLAILPQNSTVPEYLRVFDLVARGRTPWQSPLSQWSREDALAVDQALALAGVEAYSLRPLSELSGGQRQRAFIAMILAQDASILLLDEPTTFLDLPHQIELLDLVRKLNRESAKTVVMVLHDINLAARFADHVFALKDGKLHREGAPCDVITEATMRQIFGLDCLVIPDPLHGCPHVIPR